MFVDHSFESVIPETSPIGTSVIQVTATDADVGSNARISYSIVSGNVANAFNIDENHGYIYLTKILDVRLQPEYYLVVRASDAGNPSRSSYCNVRIMVIVPEEVPPKFERSSYRFELSEGTKPGRVIFGGYKIYSRQTLTYELIASHENSEHFSIDYYNGEISLIKPVDYEKRKRYELMIRATNLVGLNDTCTILVDVVDSNDNHPKWNQTLYYGQISESAPPGTPVMIKGSKNMMRLTAHDDDSGPNGDLEYYINEIHGRKHFTIDPVSGMIVLKREIYYEEMTAINFTVGLQDMGTERDGGSLDAEEDAKIVISITVPDPKFEERSVTMDLSEETQPGHIIFSGIQNSRYKQKLFYELVAFPEDKEYINVDSNSGEVTLRRSLDYEMRKRIKFVLTASNVVGAKDTASFLINIIDSNDCRPKWNKTEFSGRILEDSEVGSNVLSDNNATLILEAYDEDSGLNGKLEYYINEPHGMEYFSVNPSTGVVSLKKQLTYERMSTIIFTVSVTDMGLNQLKAERDAIVVISVERVEKPSSTTTSTSTAPSIIDYCLSSPCLNGGSCTNDPSNDSYNCSCLSGFVGDSCEDSLFICSERSPCKNRGVCHETQNYSICACQHGFQGDLCEEDIDECLLPDSPVCPPPATCINLIGSYRCICSPYIINGSTSICPGLYPSSITEGYVDQIVFLVVILFILVLTCLCFSCCWKFKTKPSSRNRTPPKSYHGPEANLLYGKTQANMNPNGNEMMNVKRFSKLSRTDGVTESSPNHPRPLSMNNFDNIRVVGIVAEAGNGEGEQLYITAPDAQRSSEVQRDVFLTHLKKATNPPIVTVTPQVTTCSNAKCSSHGSGISAINNSRGKIQNGKS